MSLYTTIHLHNVPGAREADCTRWFDGPHRAAVGTLPGFMAMDRYEVAPEQIMRDIPQPWRYLSVFDFDYPDPVRRHPAARSVDCRGTPRGPDCGRRDRAPVHVSSLRRLERQCQLATIRTACPASSIILGNYIPGRKQEYLQWYEEVHSVEVSNVPGHVAMKRGELCPIQIDPQHYCPGDQLVMCAQQTDDLAFTVKDFSERARGVSPSGIAMAPRSSSGSTARTVHYFRKVSGNRFWSGGIAYAGDLSVYPGKSNDARR